MKKLLSILGSISISASALGAVACGTVNKEKNEIANEIDKVMYTTSIPAKAQIVMQSDLNVSSDYLVSKWGSESVSEALGDKVIAKIGTKNTTVSQLLNNVLGTYTPSTSVTDTGYSPESSTLSTMKLVMNAAQVITVGGLGTSTSPIIANALNTDGGILDSIKSIFQSDGLITKIGDFLANEDNQKYLTLAANSLSWDGIEEFDSNFSNLSISTKDALQIAYNYLAYSIDELFGLDVEPSDANINDTIVKLITALADGQSLTIGDWTDLIPAIVTLIRVESININQYSLVMNYNSDNSDYLFSSSMNNMEFKNMMLSNAFWDIDEAKGNSIDISKSIKMISNILKFNDGEEISNFQKFSYILLGVSSSDEFDNNTGGLISQILHGVYDSIVPAIVTLVEKSTTNDTVKTILEALKGAKTSDAESILDALNILHLDPLNTIVTIVKDLKYLFPDLIKGIVENTNLNDFYGDLAGITGAISSDSIWGLIKDSIPKDSDGNDLSGYIQSWLQSFSKIANGDDGANSSILLGSGTKIISSLTTGIDENNLWNKTIKGLSVLKNSDWDNGVAALINSLVESSVSGFDLNELISEIVNLISPLFNKIQNMSNLTTTPIGTLLDSFGINILDGNTEISRMLYTIKKYSISDIMDYISVWFNKDSVDYQLHLGNVAYLIQTLMNKVKFDFNDINNDKRIKNDDDYSDSDITEGKYNTLQLLAWIIRNPGQKTNIKSITFYNDRNIDGSKKETTEITRELYSSKNKNIDENQNAIYTLLGLDYSQSTTKLIEGSILSGASSLLGPSTDFSDTDQKQNVSDNSDSLTAILQLIADIVEKLQNSNNDWINANIEPEINPNTWTYSDEKVTKGSIDDPTKDAELTYDITWKHNNSTLTYKVIVTRAASDSIYNTNYWEIQSVEKQ